MQYKDSVLVWLRTEKEQLAATAEAAIQEAQNCLSEGSPPTGLLAEALCTLPSEQFAMVTYSVTPPDLQNYCQAWVNYRNDMKGFNEYFSNMQLSEFRSENCQICSRRILWSDKLLLTCGHSYHRSCVKGQIVAHITGDIQSQIVCGVDKQPIEYTILQQLMMKDDYKRFTQKLENRPVAARD